MTINKTDSDQRYLFRRPHSIRLVGPQGLLPYSTDFSPGPLGHCGFYDPSFSFYNLGKEKKGPILTSELPEHAFIEKLEKIVKDDNKRYTYGYISVKASYREPLAAKAHFRKKTVTLDPTSRGRTNPMRYYFGWRPTVDCATASYKSARKMGYKAPRGSKRNLMYGKKIQLDKYTKRADLSFEQRKELIDTIELSLFEGRPVIIGVDYHSGSAIGNPDGVTDHWLMITNRLYDKNNRLYFFGIDNAHGTGKKRWKARVKLYVAPDLSIWKGTRKSRGHYTIDSSYLVTNVKVMHEYSSKSRGKRG
ncbi:hypothetical protein [uncultured Desulfobacter sp.]|uniref:hypothetical protein n=1 Tax=uncultured Desulfobacter sp. TaxID=240139 RepID=UPI0029F4FF3C|nr:hypothetical protein [uncultured Desulfobacter sp.]